MCDLIRVLVFLPFMIVPGIAVLAMADGCFLDGAIAECIKRRLRK
jgi:hypothetical protein